MLRFLNEITYEILEFLKNNGSSAAGASTVSAHLAKRGYEAAPATAGRLLKEFDDKGWTVKIGNRGRTLSKAGAAKLQELEGARWQNSIVRDMSDALDKNDGERMAELMAARLPVSVETARLAAVNASREELAELKGLVEEQELLVKDNSPVWLTEDADTRFHKLIARISRNPVLETIVALIRRSEEEARLSGPGTGHVPSGHGGEHRMIYEAIALHAPDIAALAMKRHIESVMKDENQNPLS